GSFVMFHWVKGVPFDFNSGAYDGLTLWEQIDNGAQFTPAKKYLTAVPIGLFLLSTHYTHYDAFTFLINFTFLLVVLIAKLPQLHKDGLGDMKIVDAVNFEIIIVRIGPNIRRYSEILYDKDVNSDFLDYGV
ncbi:8653_t:CDS:2, partial [Racocetra persica]